MIAASAIKLTLAAVLLGALAAGCAQMGDQLSTNFGGLPAETPQRPAVAAPTPAVHDVPAARPAPPLNDAEQLRLEKDLAAARARQGKLQDSNARKHAKDANAASAAALERAKAAAKPPSQ
jgi:hypothetical protein